MVFKLSIFKQNEPIRYGISLVYFTFCPSSYFHKQLKSRRNSKYLCHHGHVENIFNMTVSKYVLPDTKSF